jgi:hypothetical protein
VKCKNKIPAIIGSLALALVSACAPDYQQQMAQAQRVGLERQTQDLGTQDQVRQGAKTMASLLENLNAHAFVPTHVSPQEEGHKAQMISDTGDLAAGLTAIAVSRDDEAFVAAVEDMCQPARQEEERRESPVVLWVAQSATQTQKPIPGSPEAKVYDLMIATGQILGSIPSRCANFTQALADEQDREQHEAIAVAQRNAVLLKAASVVLLAGAGVALTGNAATGLALGMSAMASPATYTTSTQTECYHTGTGFNCQSR